MADKNKRFANVSPQRLSCGEATQTAARALHELSVFLPQLCVCVCAAGGRPVGEGGTGAGGGGRGKSWGPGRGSKSGVETAFRSETPGSLRPSFSSVFRPGRRPPPRNLWAPQPHPRLFPAAHSLTNQSTEREGRWPEPCRYANLSGVVYGTRTASRFPVSFRLFETSCR